MIPSVPPLRSRAGCSFSTRIGRRMRVLMWALLLMAGGSAATPAWADEAPALMLAGRYHDDIDPAAYWVSEKLDGVRAYWDGRRLLFRSGQRIAAPAWFVAALPLQPLDGELWLGRRRFERLSGIVRQQTPDDTAWHEVRYMLFDLPGAAGTFSERIVRMRAIVAAARVPWLQSVEQVRVADRAALQRRLATVLKAGGEGLMLHRADALWTAGRGESVLKLTPWLDAEARVVAHVPGKGRLAGLLGALEVEAADGRRFRLGSGFTDAQRRSPPAVGTTVTYRYRELTAKGLPRFPRYLRVRDLP